MTVLPGGNLESRNLGHQFMKITNFRRCRRWDEYSEVSSSNNLYGSANLEKGEFKERCE